MSSAIYMYIFFFSFFFFFIVHTRQHIMYMDVSAHGRELGERKRIGSRSMWSSGKEFGPDMVFSRSRGFLPLRKSFSPLFLFAELLYGFDSFADSCWL